MTDRVANITAAGLGTGDDGSLYCFPSAPVKDVVYPLSPYGQLWAGGMEGLAGGGVGIGGPGDPYRQSLWPFKLITKIARTISGIPLRLMKAAPGAGYSERSYAASIHPGSGRTLRTYRGCKAVCVGRAAEGEIIDSGPAYDLLERPCPYLSMPDFLLRFVVSFLRRGKGVWVNTDLTGRRVGQMHTVDGSRVCPVWGIGRDGMPFLKGYELASARTRGPIPLAADEVAYACIWDGSDDPYGAMPPSVPGQHSIATDYNVGLMLASAMQNGGQPGMAIEMAGLKTEEQLRQFDARLASRYAGPRGALKTLYLTEGAKLADPKARTFADLQVDEGKKTLFVEQAALYDVPPVIAGRLESAGDSSAYAGAAAEQYYGEAIFPLLDMITPLLQRVIATVDSGLVVYWDVEDQPVVQRMRQARIDQAVKLHAMARPWEDIDSVLDLGMPKRPWDSVGWIAAGMLPVTEAVVPAPNPGEVPPPAEEPEEAGPGTGDQGPGEGEAPTEPELTSDGLRFMPLSKSAADARWHAVMTATERLARACERPVRMRYVKQERLIIAAMKRRITAGPGTRDHGPGTTAGAVLSGPVVKDPGVVAAILLEVFGDSADKGSFKARIAAFFRDAQQLGIDQALREGGLEGEALEAAKKRLLASPWVEAAVANRSLVISTRVDDRTRDILRRQLTAGMDQGETVGELASRVQETMGGRRADAINVARNTVGQALSQARHEGQKATGMTHKYWLHSRGGGVRRPSHVDAERRYVRTPIPIDEPFVIDGSELMYPRDPSGPPEETINCECVQVAVRARQPKDAAGQTGATA